MPSDQKRLESWKEIAAYLNREVRTARRWEKERGLPVYRIPGKRSGVYAVAPEIDAWLKAKAPNGSIGDSIIEGPSGPRRSGDRNLMPWAATGVLLLAVALFSNVPLVTPGVPQLRHPVRITNDGLLKAGLRDGGRSLFFVSLPFEHQTLKRISESGISVRHPLSIDRVRSDRCFSRWNPDTDSPGRFGELPIGLGAPHSRRTTQAACGSLRRCGCLVTGRKQSGPLRRQRSLFG